MNPNRPLKVLILSDGKPGHLNQSLGIIDRLSEMIPVESSLIEIRHRNKLRDDILRILMRLIGRLPIPGNCALALLRWSLSYESWQAASCLLPVDIIISTGSSVAATNLLLRRVLGGKSVVSLKPSPTGIGAFDLAVLPRHLWRRRRRENVCRTIGVPNRIVPTVPKSRDMSLSLEDDAELRIGMLFGGRDKYSDISPTTAEIIARQLILAAETLGAKLLVTTSRRTPPETERRIEDVFGGSNRCELLALAGRDPETARDAYPCILDKSTAIAVTEDSMSMISEAASSGKAVVIVPVDRRKRRKPKRWLMYEEICRQSNVTIAEPSRLACALQDAITSRDRPRPALSDAAKVASEILRKLV